MEKEILVVIRGIENFLIFLNPKAFLIRTDYKTILSLVKKKIINASTRRPRVGIYGLNSFPSLLNICRDQKFSNRQFNS